MIYLRNKSAAEFTSENSSIALGKFDGIHIGHQDLIKRLIKDKEKGYRAIVFSFAISPRFILHGGEKKTIYTSQEKALYLSELGVDVLMEYPFTKKFANSKPEDFVKDCLVDKLNVKQIYVGEDFCFGKNRQGNVSLLKELGEKYGFHVCAIPQRKFRGKIVSSSLIRDLIGTNFSVANRMLGNPYFIYNEVIHGKHLGNTIGFPTINQEISSQKIVPQNGVYASRVLIDGKSYQAISNLGVKPTIKGENQLGLETYILDYSGDLYNKFIKTELLYFIRKERKFDNLTALKRQIEKDVAVSRKNT